MYTVKMRSLDVAALFNVPKLPVYINQVEQELNSVLMSSNRYIRLPLTRLFNAKSKRLRPMFIIAVANAQGAKIDGDVIKACSAIELLHIASLVHDDIRDNADMRWHIPPLNAREGVNQAIIFGDFLFAKAFEQAASVNLDVARLIGTSFAALCDGESRETADSFSINRSVQALLTTHRGKTASLFSASCRIGAVCADSSRSALDAFTGYGKNFGMAFQLTDDLLDLLSTEELLGKPVHKDVVEGSYTMPIILALKGLNSKTLKKLLVQDKLNNELLIETLLKSGSIQATLHKIQKYNKAAAESIGALRASPSISALKNLPSNYLDAALKNYVDPKYQGLA